MKLFFCFLNVTLQLKYSGIFYRYKKKTSIIGVLKRCYILNFNHFYTGFDVIVPLTLRTATTSHMSSFFFLASFTYIFLLHLKISRRNIILLKYTRLHPRPVSTFTFSGLAPSTEAQNQPVDCCNQHTFQGSVTGSLFGFPSLRNRLHLQWRILRPMKTCIHVITTAKS